MLQSIIFENKAEQFPVVNNVCSLSVQYKMYNEDSRSENCLVLKKC